MSNARYWYRRASKVLPDQTLAQEFRDLQQRVNSAWIHIDAEMGIPAAAACMQEFVAQCPIAILNMAGSRQSEEPQVGEFLSQVMDRAFGSSADQN
ncbi:MAG: hypothetical protein HC851_06235 [Acaryochloris sp. RU_4_1]|nr:hypothetical protein [Acaryochloris sp. SU_5_25]NJM65286.1 hypothetical protein [Acaryochloris sp. RU_4_1]NJR54850.1 hypothetical protein [Acaryochloris sp. CRU_2_0]